MTGTKHLRCVNCGEPAAALFKTYGPTVLKLTKCKKCKGIVDKYIEYDPVIVMIDLVLMSKEAQRHVLFNTEFKSYWKLLVILVMLETYGVWRNDSLFTIVISSVCGFHNNSTINSTSLSIPLNITVPEWLRSSCDSWESKEKGDDDDLFIWEKDFYIKFISIFAGIAVFILTLQSSMQLLKPLTSHNQVCAALVLRSVSLWQVGALLALPALVWPAATLLHYSLVFLYGFVVLVHVFTVLYECSTPLTIIILSVSIVFKYSTSFFITSYLKTFVT